MAMFSPVNQRGCIGKASLKHTIVNIPLDMYTKTNIESDVMAMNSPDKSMRVRLKGILET